MNRIVKYRLLAFFLIAMSTMGTVMKEDLQKMWAISSAGALDAVLIAALIAGLGLWMVSKRMEKQLRKKTEEKQ